MSKVQLLIRPLFGQIQEHIHKLRKSTSLHHSLLLLPGLYLRIEASELPLGQHDHVYQVFLGHAKLPGELTGQLLQEHSEGGGR